jgi:hypothetical protein
VLLRHANLDPRTEAEASPRAAVLHCDTRAHIGYDHRIAAIDALDGPPGLPAPAASVRL